MSEQLSHNTPIESNPAENLTDLAGQSDKVQCPFCEGILNQPRQLQCGHYLCTTCVDIIYSFETLQSFEVCTSKIHVPREVVTGEAQIQLQHQRLESLVCPVCRKLTLLDQENPIESLPTNQHLNSECAKLIKQREFQLCGWCEKVPAQMECSKCEVIYCDECKQATHSRQAFQNHEFLRIGVLEQNRFKTCEKHKGRRKDIYCQNCQQSICLYCTKFEEVHKDHTLTSFPEANQKLHLSIENLISQHQYLQRELDFYSESIARATTNLREGLQEMETSIKRSFQQMHDLLTTREEQLIFFAQLRTQQDLKLGKVLQKSAETVKKYSESVELAYPKDAQDPSVLRSYSLKLQRVIRKLEDIQMESSLCPMKFGFELGKFKSVIENIGCIVEQLDLGDVESSILGKESLSKLTFWLSREIGGRKECTLVYRASHNGWSDQKFFEISGKISEPTLIVAKTESGKVFGGFQFVPRKKSNSFTGKEAFLFSLGNGNEDSEDSWFLCENMFQAGAKNFQFSARDLSFQLNSRAAASQLGHSFAAPQGQNPDTLLLGALQARLVEFELFCIGNPQVRGPKMQEILRGQPLLKRALSEFIGQQYHPSNLLYKASRDGWFANAFHELCDNKGATLVIAKSEHGNIFGGFASKDWGSENIGFKGYVTDPKAILFSLTDGHGREPVVLRPKSANNTVQNDFKAGPCFGAGPDLRLSLNDQMVHCNPRTYLIPSGYRQDTFLAGHALARLDEVEVYWIPS